MSEQIIQRLLGSFKILEDAITTARETMTSRPNVDAAILDRLNSYTGLLVKQREVANGLKGAIDAGHWQEVAQKIAVINGLLEMIRNDAKEVLEALTGEEKIVEPDKASQYVC